MRPVSRLVETCVARLSHKIAPPSRQRARLSLYEMARKRRSLAEKTRSLAEKTRTLARKTRYARLYGRTEPLLQEVCWGSPLGQAPKTFPSRDDDAVAARFFGFIKRGIGAMKKRLEGIGFARVGDAQRNGKAKWLTVR